MSCNHRYHQNGFWGVFLHHKSSDARVLAHRFAEGFIRMKLDLIVRLMPGLHVRRCCSLKPLASMVFSAPDVVVIDRKTQDEFAFIQSLRVSVGSIEDRTMSSRFIGA